MKLAIISIILILLIVPTIQAKAITENMKVLDSTEIKNQNITLLNLDNKEDKVILCVNGVKRIISEDNTKTINDVVVTVKAIRPEYAKIRLESNCKNCVLNNNNACLHECNINSDCNDYKEETTNNCTGEPRKCTFTEIKKPEPIEKKEENLVQNIVINIENTEPKKEEPKPNFLTEFLNWLSNLFSNSRW